MPTFTGNLKTIGIEPKNGLFPEITLTAERAGVDLITSELIAGSRTFTPASNGDVTLISASTLGLVPETKVKLTGRWLGDDSFFELPAFHIPAESGTLADLLAFSGLSSQQYISWGVGAPDRNYPGAIYYDLSLDPPKIWKRGA